MHIAICDDEINVRSYIRELIEKQDIKTESCISEYTSGEELLAAVRDGSVQNIDLLFLDVAMGGTDGMSVAKDLRRMQAEKGQAAWGSLPLIVFVTGFPEYMPAAFFVNAFQFIVKPIDEVNFRDVFRQVMREYESIQKKSERAEKEIAVANGGSRNFIKAGNILYIESSRHKNIICLQNKRIEYYGRISDLEQELKPDFFRIHRGYLININHIDHYDHTDVYMDNGDRLSISRYKYQEFVKAHLQHMTEDNASIGGNILRGRAE